LFCWPLSQIVGESRALQSKEFWVFRKGPEPSLYLFDPIFWLAKRRTAAFLIYVKSHLFCFSVIKVDTTRWMSITSKCLELQEQYTWYWFHLYEFSFKKTVLKVCLLYLVGWCQGSGVTNFHLICPRKYLKNDEFEVHKIFYLFI
jgi:hypothetical protein